MEPRAVDASPGRPVPALARPALVVPAVIVLVTVALDQLTKWWALAALEDGDVIELIPTLEFDLAYNSGFSFGTGTGLGRWIAVLVVGLCGFLVHQILVSERPARARLLAVILGGALGNLVDRIFRADDGPLSGEVIDFIDVTWYAVFNVADIFVVCGCIAFGVYEVMVMRHERAEPHEAEAPADA